MVHVCHVVVAVIRSVVLPLTVAACDKILAVLYALLGVSTHR